MAHHRSLSATPTFSSLIDLITTLRGENGCPWDRKQTPESMTVYLIEETYELVEAVKAGEVEEVQEELGDVLFQILFLMVMYQEQGLFDLTQVLGRNLRKMIHRHPHVFGEEGKLEDAEAVKKQWLMIKQGEKTENSGSLMDSVPAALPALLRSYRISERAASIGFDWDDLQGVLGQAEAEWEEFKAELDPDAPGGVKDQAKAAEEFGDILFTLVNVARLARIHPETALSQATRKFIRRFKHMEEMASAGGDKLRDVSRQRMEEFWRAAKAKDSP